jgi:glycosyltransferase involved in cell wall biosynthesis
MKIVQFEDFFHPDAGYNINIFSKYMSKLGHDVVILTSEIDKTPMYLKTFFDCNDISTKDKKYEDENGVIIKRIKTHFFYSGRSIIALKIFNTIKSYKPDIVYIHGNDTYFGILSTLFHRLILVPIVYDTSMVEMASKNRFNWMFRFTYRLMVAPIIKRNEFKVIRTQDDNYVTKHLGIPFGLSPLISLGVDTEKFSPIAIDNKVREELAINKDDFVVTYAGKIDLSKGAELLLSVLAKKMKSTRNIVFLLIGNVNPEVEGMFKSTLKNSKNSIIHIPTVTYSQLNKYYQASDIALFPRQISLSFFNAQACGLPVIAESNNINDERLSHGNGVTFKFNDSGDLYDKIIELSIIDKNAFKDLSSNSIEYVNNYYDYNKIILEYIDLFQEELIRSNKSL